MTNSFFESELSDIEKMRQYMEAALKGVKEEFDDHLEGINDNTNEIQANYEYITKIDEKITALHERLANVESLLSRVAGVPIESHEEHSIALTEKEKKICLLLYTADENAVITYEDIAAITGDNEFLVRGYITNLMEKGVPIHKRYAGKTAHLTLDSAFKEKQAKTNILGLSQNELKISGEKHDALYCTQSNCYVSNRS